MNIKIITKTIFSTFFMAVLALAIVIQLQSDTFKIERKAKFSAPAPVLFSQVDNLMNWNQWSPWAQIDPNAKYVFEGPKEGVGAKLSWVGNSEIGEGSMQIIGSEPYEFVRFSLHFMRPFESSAVTNFTFQPIGDSETLVIWTMQGEANFMSKAVGLFMDCEKIVGAQFEQGFVNLQSRIDTLKQASSVSH